MNKCGDIVYCVVGVLTKGIDLVPIASASTSVREATTPASAKPAFEGLGAMVGGGHIHGVGICIKTSIRCTVNEPTTGDVPIANRIRSV